MPGPYWPRIINKFKLRPQYVRPSEDSIKLLWQDGTRRFYNAAGLGIIAAELSIASGDLSRDGRKSASARPCGWQGNGRLGREVVKGIIALL
jgi:hypothetical protein